MREFLIYVARGQVVSAGVLAIVIVYLAVKKRENDLRRVAAVLAIVFVANYVVNYAINYRLYDEGANFIKEPESSTEDIIEQYLNEPVEEDPIWGGIKVLPNDDPGPGDMCDNPTRAIVPEPHNVTERSYDTDDTVDTVEVSDAVEVIRYSPEP